MSRRAFTGGVTAGALLAACGEPGSGDDVVAAPDASSGIDAEGTCAIYPQETEGPYYLDDRLTRRDVTEGKAGATLTLLITVRGADCQPMAGVAVDIWHCDADGVYSGFPGQLGGLDTTGMTFLRGTQLTDDSGVAQFETIYPGWYPGRTTHIHFKVHPTPTSEATSQMYFDEALTADVYTSAPYDTHGPKDTSNANDGAAAGNLPPLVVITGDANAYTGTLIVTVA